MTDRAIRFEKVIAILRSQWRRRENNPYDPGEQGTESRCFQCHLAAPQLEIVAQMQLPCGVHEMGCADQVSFEFGESSLRILWIGFDQPRADEIELRSMERADNPFPDARIEDFANVS